MKARADIVIVGGGLAGAATAYRLSRAGVRDVVVLEREAAPGAHASGKNAGLVRRLLDDPELVPAALAGAAFLDEPPPEVARAPLARRTGSLVLSSLSTAGRLAGVAARVGAARIAPGEAARLAPGIEGGRFEAAFHTAADGVADIRGLLEGLLAGARAGGAEVVTGCAALGLDLEGGRVAGIRTSLGRIETRAVVDAAGPWAGALAREAGAEPPALGVFRRHLFIADHRARSLTVAVRKAPGAPAAAPWVWNVDEGFYFRAEGERGLLLSACDEEPHAALAPDADPAAARALRARAAAVAPALGPLEIVRSWACLRTFAADGRFVVGATPDLPGLHYAAGLGGHGVTTAAALGALAADAVLHPDGVPAAFRAARAVRHAAGGIVS